jgi:hypothetical protein
MTARADRLTKRANPADREGSVPSSDPASTVRVFVDALERLDYGMTPLLATAGIRRADLDDPDARIPRTAWDPLLCRALEQRPMKNARRPRTLARGSRVSRAISVSPRLDPFPVFARMRTRFGSYSRVATPHSRPSSP